MLTSSLNNKGLNQDANPKFQPEGTYRFALNAVLETSEGDLGTICNENSNGFCGTGFPNNKKVIGHTLTDTNDIVLFLFDPDDKRPEHEIGYYNPQDCTYVTIAKSALFNFSDKHPINAIFRLKNGCTKFLYWTDDYNDYKAVNLTDTSDWVFPTTKFVKSLDKILYSKPYYVPDITGSNSNPYIEGVADGGGELEYGTYSFAFQYIDYDGNPTDWMAYSRYFPIGSNQMSSAGNIQTYHQYTGASNTGTTQSNPYYRAPTSKSILLNIKNVSTSFSKFRLAVIKRTSDSGAISGVDVLSEVDIVNPTNESLIDITYLYTGSDSQVFLQTSIEELFSERLKLGKVAAHTQADNRLFIANTSKDTVDYTGFQRHASSIKTEWQQEEAGFISNYDKLGISYQTEASFQHDEVYALGIVYQFKPGSPFGNESPVFHIPGRPVDIIPPSSANNYYISPLDSNPLDTHTIDLSDPNLLDAGERLRWKNYNTYTKYGPEPAGLMGYYETSTVYGTVNNVCDTHPDGYWGRDYTGTLITPTTHVRHHRTPLPIASLDTANAAHKIGLRFTIIEDYPHPDIIGHRFVYADRTNERTVLDTGLLTYLPEINNEYVGVELHRINIQNFWANATSAPLARVNAAYLSNSVVFDSKLLQGNHLRFTKALTTDPMKPVGRSFCSSSPTTQIVGVDLTATSDDRYLNAFAPPIEFNFKTLSTNYLQKKSSAEAESVLGLPTGQTARSASRTFDFGIFVVDRLSQELDLALTDFRGPYQCFIKSTADVYSELSNLNYKSCTKELQIKEEGIDTTYTTFEGDVHVSFSNYSEMFAVETGSNEFRFDIRSVAFDNEHFINSTFRSEGTNESAIWKPSWSSNCGYALAFAAAKIKRTGDVIDYVPEVYSLNRSYDYMRAESVYIPLAKSFDYCSTCGNEDFPYRIYYSESDTQEGEEDLYRKIRVNNYRDLDGYTGPITDLFTFKTDIFALTTNSPYSVPYRPQNIQVGDLQAYLGTGEVLSVPPRQLKTTEYAFAGTSHFKARVLTEYGAAYADDISGRVFLISEGLRDLSLNGMRNFFQENGRLGFREQYRNLTGRQYPYIGTTSVISVGYILAYDPRFKRLIVTKKDYRLTDAAKVIFKYSETTPSEANTLWFNGVRWYYRPTTTSFYEVDFTNKEFFEDRSFTISYSFLSDSWVSFHSYLPYYLLNDHSTFFSNGPFKHNREYSYQQYYGDKKDFVIDFITTLSPQEIKTYSYSSIRAKMYKYDVFSKQFQDDTTTFDRGIIYNSRQTSGLVTFSKDVLFDIGITDVSIAPLKGVDSTYRVSKFRDNTVSNNLPIWTSNWDAISNTYFIDKIPNVNNIDSSVSLFDQKRFKDYYLGTRLFFKPQEDIKLCVDIIDTNYSSRNR